MLVDPIDLGVTPKWSDVIFALGVATVVFTRDGVGRGAVGRGDASAAAALKRLIGSATVVVMVVYVGIALVAMTAFPVADGTTGAERAATSRRRCSASPTRSTPTGWRRVFKYTISIAATATLIAASNSAMLGLSRLAYSLSRNRQIPSAMGAPAPDALDAVRADHHRPR